MAFFKPDHSRSHPWNRSVDRARKETRIFLNLLAIVSTGIATISLFTALGFWNDWFQPSSYIKSDNLYHCNTSWCKSKTISYIAKNVGSIRPVAGAVQSIHGKQDVWPWWLWQQCQSPFYPFFQRYFVRLAIGGVKNNIVRWSTGFSI